MILPVANNVLGTALETCSDDPMTGFYRDGCCRTGPEDHGLHLVCVVLTDEFLKFSREAGNDLSTPHPEFGFPGLKGGEKWCLCVTRWRDALEAGCAPKVSLRATHISTLEFVTLDDLKRHAIDNDPEE